MSELFGDYKRPKAEKKVIEKIIKIYEKSKDLFKNKNYLEALEGLKNSYQLLLDIWDKYPKIIILYLLMKGYFYTEQFDKSKAIIDQLESMLIFIPREKNDVFIKIKSKILVYQLILYYIGDDIDSSIDSIIGMIKYLSNHPFFDLEDKAKFFWHYIKSFLKITGITNSNKFHLLKEGFNSMIVEEVKLTNNNGNDENKNNQNEESKPIKKVNRFMMETYKNFMNSKLRGIIYEVLDKEFYYVKYHKINDKVMMFLHKNINIFVRDNNKERLLELFHTFVVLNKTNLKKEYNMTLDELVFEQKRRIEAFDRIFSNLVGAFNHIFRQYFAEELPNLSKRIRNKSNIKNFKININELKNLIKIRIQSPGKETKINEFDKNIKNKSKKLLFKINLNKKKEKDNNKNNNISNNDDVNIHFIKEISIPPNTEAMDRQILLDNFITRRNLIKKNLMIQYSRNNEVNVNKLKKKKIEYNLHLPNISDKKYSNLNIRTERNRNNIYNTYTTNIYDNRTLSHRNYKVKCLKKKKTESELENSSKLIDKKNDDNFIIRNINNYLITKIIEHFNSAYNIQHEITTEEKIDISLVYPRKKDIYDFNIPNNIHSHGAVSIKGSKTENQDSFFCYNNYFLIKNVTLFGVCDGHGKYGKDVSYYLSILFPSYLYYILLDDNLIERKIDINKKIFKLLKIQESPSDIKSMFLLRYFFNKFEMDFSLLPLITGNQNIFFHQIYESLYYSQKELKERYEIDITNSGTTLCSGLIHGNILYLINVGDSRAILGTYYTRFNKWKTTQLSTDHKPNNPNENKRIIAYKGRVDRFKSQFGEEYGPYRVFGRENDGTYPGLAVSRSIGDEDAKKLGVIFEPEVIKYELKKQDKILVIASDGLWEELSNEEVMDIVGNCYNRDIKCEEAANILIENIAKKVKNNDNNKDESKRTASNSKSKEDENYNDNKEGKKEIKKYLDNITCIVIYLDIK